MEYSILKSFDNEKLYLKIYKVDNPKGAIQIVHGMMEHQERYRDFAHFLNQNGYTVITSDLRGHGSNCTELGFFKNKYGT
jgi:alpha-beta hydrolase superfamily lysophospholipase